MPIITKFQQDLHVKLTSLSFNMSKFIASLSVFELRHDKTNKVTVRPAKTQISLGIRLILSYPLSAQRRF